jgi:short-subunit dehydrogenase
MNFDLRDRVVVLTGAASGIGAELAVQLAGAGANLALIDRDADGLKGTRRRITADVRVSCHVVDLADRQAIAALPDAVIATHQRVSMLISNAGVALIGRFEDYGAGDFEWLMNINFWAGVRLSQVFMPSLRQAPMAQIVYLSSIYGIIGAPGSVAYCASKFAIKGFAEALRQELRHSNIGITIVHPGGVNTNIARAAKIAAGTDEVAARDVMMRFQKMLRVPPAAAATAIINGLRQRKQRILIGTDSHVIDVVKRLMPATADKMMANVAAKMETSVGPSR